MAPKAVYLHGAMLDPNATVDALIDGNTKWWNSTLLGAIFTQEEVSLIQSIPVSSIGQKVKRISKTFYQPTINIFQLVPQTGIDVCKMPTPTS
jgi:hypothetical protein